MLENMIHSYIYIYANKILKRLNAPKCRMVVRSEETTEKYSKYKENSRFNVHCQVPCNPGQRKYTMFRKGCIKFFKNKSTT